MWSKVFSDKNFPVIPLLCVFLCANNVVTYVGPGKARYIMAINYDELGKRISYFRARKGFSQETHGERIGVNNKHISNIEIGKSRPSLDSLVEIANALGISADDLLVDSLKHSVSTADSDLHRMLLECNEMEETILTRTVKELKVILYSLGI